MGHEPGCGMTPLVDLAGLPGWDSTVEQVRREAREQVAHRTHREEHDMSEALKARALVAPLPNYHEDCTEGVVRADGEEEPCGQPAVAVRMDPNEGEPCPVCARHTRGVMVPLVRVVNASKVEALRDARRYAAEHPIVTRAELDRLRSGIEALADEFKRRHEDARFTGIYPVDVAVLQTWRTAEAAVRALLSADDEAEVSA